MPNLQDIKNRYNIVGNCDALNRALDIALHSRHRPHPGPYDNSSY